MARGMFRGAATAWLGLIVVQGLSQQRGADAVGGLLGTVNGLVQRVLDPAVPAIPDHSKASVSPGDTPSPALNGITPNQLRNAAQAAPIIASPGFQAGIKNAIPQGDLAPLQKQLAGLSNYTPAQLAQAWGIPYP